jgi:hypothetical protein
MDMSYTQDVYKSHGTEFFRTSNYVQQRETYTRKAATVHLNCSTVPCNTLCARIAAAVWRKTCDVICDLQVRDLGMQYPAVRHIHVKKVVEHEMCFDVLYNLFSAKFLRNSVQTFRFNPALLPSNVKKISGISWPLKMGPIGCPEMSVRNYHSAQHNIQKESRSLLNGFCCLMSPRETCFPANYAVSDCGLECKGLCHVIVFAYHSLAVCTDIL